MKTVSGFNENFIPGPFALAASPARYAVERGDWQGAAALEVRPSPLPQARAITYFAKALGAARSGDLHLAQASITKLAELRDQLREKKDGYWAEQVDIQWQVATAWAMDAAGQHDEALKILSAAADAEDKTEKHPLTPGPLAPARELYGAMLLERGMATGCRVDVCGLRERPRCHGSLNQSQRHRTPSFACFLLRARERGGEATQAPEASRRCRNE
jgi:hypothetical protein